MKSEPAIPFKSHCISESFVSTAICACIGKTVAAGRTRTALVFTPIPPPARCSSEPTTSTAMLHISGMRSHKDEPITDPVPEPAKSLWKRESQTTLSCVITYHRSELRRSFPFRRITFVCNPGKGTIDVMSTCSRVLGATESGSTCCGI